MSRFENLPFIGRFFRDSISQESINDARDSIFSSLSEGVHVSHGDGFASSNLGLGTDIDKAEMMELFRDRRKNRGELDTLYEQSGLIRKIVDLPINGMMRMGVNVHHDKKKEIYKRMMNLGAWPKINTSAKWGRIFRFSCVFIDLDDGMPLHEPVNVKLVKGIKDLKVYDEQHITPYYYEYGDNEPTYYQVTGLVGRETFLIHKDRLLVFNGFNSGYNNQMYNCGMGSSIVDAIYKPFRNLDADYNAASTMAKDYRVIKFKIAGLENKTKKTPKEKAVRIKDRITTMKRMLSIVNGYVTAGEDDIDFLQNNIYGYPELVKLTKEYLCWVSQIPHNRLFSEGTGKDLGSGKGEGEESEWVETLRDFQMYYFSPQFYKLLEYICASMGIYEVPEYEFPYPIPQSPLSIAKVRSENAKAYFYLAQGDRIYLETFCVNVEEVRRNRMIENQGEDGDMFFVESDEPPLINHPNFEGVDPSMEQFGSEDPSGEAENPLEQEFENKQSIKKGTESNRRKQKTSVRLSPQMTEKLKTMKSVAGTNKSAIIEKAIERVLQEQVV